jgi:hypothetical protein
MDPDANLKEQLRQAASILAHIDDMGDEAELAQSAGRLAELVEALDMWIKGGGFLPKAWIVGEGRNR